MSARDDPAALPPRPMAVADMFYPASPAELGLLVDELLAAAESAHPVPGDLDLARLAGILVPHAGLVYSGVVAAAAWRLVGERAASPTIVILGTNHRAAWLAGVGAWDRGPWSTPLGNVPVDDQLTSAVLALGPPFGADARCHIGEHSIEVQLPFIARLAPGARVVALSVGSGTGSPAVEAGAKLGRVLAEQRAAGRPVLLAISSDMAHYPGATIAERVTQVLLPHIAGLDPAALAAAEAEVSWSLPGVSCGMCGIDPTVLGLASLRAMGARAGVPLAAATSADAGGDARRTVGYLAVAFQTG